MVDNTNYLKSNDNVQDARFKYPLPPEDIKAKKSMEIYARFMRHLRCVPNSNGVIKILSSIQFTADMLNESDAYIAKILVDLGLRAPRGAFPDAYLEFVDKSLMRNGYEVGSPTAAMLVIKEHWDKIGDDQSTAIKTHYVGSEETRLI